MVDFNFLSELSHSTSILLVLDFYNIKYQSIGAGRYKTICLFHDDTSPSLTIYHNHGNCDSFYCYACGTGGDPFRFIQLIENNFQTALSILCKINNIDSESFDIDPLQCSLQELEGNQNQSDIEKNNYNLQLSILYRELLKQFPKLSKQVDSRFQQIDEILKTSSPVEFKDFFHKEIKKIKKIREKNENSDNR